MTAQALIAAERAVSRGIEREEIKTTRPASEWLVSPWPVAA